MPTPNRLAAITQFFRDLIPTRIITRHDPRTVTAALAHTVAAEDVLAIFRNAEAGNTDRLFALYRDILLAHAHLQGRFTERKEAVLGDVFTVQPYDKTQPADVATATAIQEMQADCPDWHDALNHLLDSFLWPVALVEKVYAPAGRGYRLVRLVPVPHDLLDFQNGRLRVKDTDSAGRPLGTTSEPTPQRYIIHRGHLLTTPDNWGGPMRSLVFWWLLGTMDREWWGRFLDRYGSPFPVGKVDSGDDDSRIILERAFSLATKIGGLVVSRETEIEIKQAAAADAGTAFEKFHDVCNREISKLILGQTLSSDAQATGMGSGVASSQDGIRQDKRQSDAMRLAATLRKQLFTQFVQINGLPGRPPLAGFGGVDHKEAAGTAALMASLKNAGVQLTDDGIASLSERIGLPLERAAAPASPISPFSVATFSAPAVGQGAEIDLREAAASLSQSLGKHHAQVRAIILGSRSPAAALAEIETYAAAMQPGDRARIIEEVLLAYAANGSVAEAR